MKKIKICYLVTNDLSHDPRVTKQIKSAVEAGLEVLVIAWDPYLKEPKFTSKQGYKVIYGCLRNEELFAFWPRLEFAAVLYNLRQFIKYPGLRFIDKFPKIYRIYSRIYLTYYRIVHGFIGWLILIKKNLNIMFGKNSHQQEAHPGKKEFLSGSQIDEQKQIRNKPLMQKFRERYSIFTFYYAYYRSVNRFMAEEGARFSPDIIHANDLDTLTAGYEIKKRTGAKLIYDAHEIWTEQGMNIPKLFLWRFKRFEKKLLKKIDCFITVNQSIIKEISRMYQHRFKVPTLVVYNSPNYQKVNYKPSQGKKVRFLYQGRYSIDRGFEELIEAAKMLLPQGVIEFRAVGDEAFRKFLQIKVSENKLQDKVKFLKPVNMDDMVTAASASDVGIISYIGSNINNYLCTPNKLFEYPMAGLGLAVSDLPELRRVIKLYKNGVIFNPKDPKSIANALNSLIKRKSQLNQFKKRSLEAAKEMNWEIEQLKLIKIYKKLTND